MVLRQSECRLVSARGSPGLRASLRSLGISLCLGMRHAWKWLAGVGCLLMGWLMPIGLARHCFAQHMSSGQMW